MKKYLSVIFLSFIIAGCCATGSGYDNNTYIVIIGVDGLSPDGIMHAETPNLDLLIKNGASTMHGRAVRPTSSSQNWASMLMGAGPLQNGITSNGWERNNFDIPPTETGIEDDIFPSIFDLIKMQKKNLVTASVYDWSGFGRLYAKSAVDYDFDTDGPEKTVDKAVELFKEHKPNYTFIHLDHVDGAGHEYGHGTRLYYDAVERADSCIGVILQGLKDSGMYDDAVIVICSDHGGKGFGHGGDSMAEVEIPYIISGKGIRKGIEITSPYFQYDNSAASAYILGLETPISWIGRPPLSAFESSDDDVKEKYSKPHMFTPVISKKGGVFLEEYFNTVISVNETNAEIRYTVDGSEPDLNSPLFKNPIPVVKSMVIKAKAYLGNKVSSTVTEKYTILKKDNGISYNYFENRDKEDWKMLPDFSGLKVISSGNTYRFLLEEITEKQNDQYAIVFESNIQIDKDGEYTFYTISDDGSKLYLDNNLVVNNDGSHGAGEKNGTINLKSGRYKIKVEYFEDYAGETLRVLYKGPGIEKQEIPSYVLFK